MCVAVCNKMVDLPMPGSPPINTTEPVTKPPPKTRSNSAMPVAKRVSCETEILFKVVMLATCPA